MLKLTGNEIYNQIHAYLDYPVAVALIALPFVFTLLTDHQLGAYRIIPYKGHLALDALVGIVFVVAPFIFSFQGVDAYYYWIIGGSVLTVVSLHRAETAVSLQTPA